MLTLDPTAWAKKYGNYEQHGGRGRLHRVRDVRGRTSGWDIMLDERKIGHATRLSQAKTLACRLTTTRLQVVR